MTEARSPAEPEAEPREPAHGVVRKDGSRGSLHAMPTSELRLRPSLVDALKGIAPKRQRSATRYIVALALLAAIGGLAASPKVRQLVLARIHAHDAPLVTAADSEPLGGALDTPAASGSAASVVPDPSASASAPRVVVPGSAVSTASSSAPPAPPKKAGRGGRPGQR